MLLALVLNLNKDKLECETRWSDSKPINLDSSISKWCEKQTWRTD